MEFDKAMESAPEWYWIELPRVANKMLTEFFPIKTSEQVVVTADTQSDWRTVQAVVRAIYALGATPTLVLHPTTPVASSDPPPAVIAAVQACDAWIGLGESYLLYSTAWTEAMKAGVRFWAMLSGVDFLMKMVDGIDYAVLDNLANKLIELANRAKEMHITSAQGTDLHIKVDASASCGHDLFGKGLIKFEGNGMTRVPPGQATFGHVPDSVEGTLVFDGFISPPDEIGVLKEPVKLEVHKGKITNITGGREAKTFERFLASWNHPAMYEIAHCTYGFNPGVKRCKGSTGHDERVFGCLEFGIGPKWANAPCHTDGGVMQPSIWADDVQLEEDGKYVHPELAELARQLGVGGY